MTRTKAPSRHLHPCFVGFWVTQAQRDKLDEFMRRSGRGLGQVCRILIDKAVLQVIEIDLESSPPSTPTHAA
jgi:hypothetical protein